MQSRDTTEGEGCAFAGHGNSFPPPLPLSSPRTSHDLSLTLSLYPFINRIDHVLSNCIPFVRIQGAQTPYSIFSHQNFELVPNKIAQDASLSPGKSNCRIMIGIFPRLIVSTAVQSPAHVHGITILRIPWPHIDSSPSLREPRWCS